MDRTIRRYAKLYHAELTVRQTPDAQARTAAYEQRLGVMYASEAFAKHNAYPTMDVRKIYAVIAMCLELQEEGLADSEIIDFVNGAFARVRALFDAVTKAVDLLPCCYRIARKRNISDHDKRVADGSITYGQFDVSEGRIEYRITGCMYVEMFAYYGIRSLCKIFCMTDERAYANLTRHVIFIRHSDLSDGDVCHDEVIQSR